VLASVLAAWDLQPHIDWAALAPEVVVTLGALLLILADSIFLERARPYMSILAGGTLLGAMIPVIFLANDGADRILFDGAYVGSRATSSCCCRRTTSPRATTGRASTTRSSCRR
jgi:NADH-quinone oxidoreductase subunit N